MRPEVRVDRLEPGRHARARARVKLDLAAAADAVAEGAQPVRRRRAVPLEAAQRAARGRLRALVQSAFNVPSRCSSAFAWRWASGSEPPVVWLGAGAYGYVVPPASGKTYALPSLAITVIRHLGG